MDRTQYPLAVSLKYIQDHFLKSILLGDRECILRIKQLSQVDTGNQVLGDLGQRIDLNTHRVYSRKREQIY